MTTTRWMGLMIGASFPKWKSLAPVSKHSGHWGQIRPGKCLDYDPISSKFSRISMTVLVFIILM